MRAGWLQGEIPSLSACVDLPTAGEYHQLKCRHVARGATSAMSTDVFISWSGLRSRQLASLLHDWIPKLSSEIQTWMSDSDVPAGEQWIDVLIEKARSARAMVVCLTPENQDSRWLHFEAGLSMGKPVIPVLQGLDPGDVHPPLSVFNCCIADDRGMQKLLSRLTQVLAVPAVEQHSFDINWPTLGQAIEKIDALSEDRIAPSGAYRGHLTAIGLTPFVALKYLSRLADPEMRRDFLRHSLNGSRASIAHLRMFAEREAVSPESSPMIQHIMWTFATNSSLDYLHYAWEGEWSDAVETILSTSETATRTDEGGPDEKRADRKIKDRTRKGGA